MWRPKALEEGLEEQFMIEGGVQGSSSDAIFHRLPGVRVGELELLCTQQHILLGLYINRWREGVRVHSMIFAKPLIPLFVPAKNYHLPQRPSFREGKNRVRPRGRPSDHRRIISCHISRSAKTGRFTAAVSTPVDYAE